MKKLLLMFAAVAAMTFVSCDPNSGNTTTETQEPNNDSVITALIENFDTTLANAADSVAIQDVMNNAQTEVQKLIDAGDTEGAKNLWEKVQEVLAKNADKLATVWPAFAAKAEEFKANVPESLKGLVDAGIQKAGEAIEGAADKATDAAAGAVEATKDAAAGAVEAGKDAAAGAVEAGKDAVKDAKEAAKDAAADAIKKL